MNEIMQTVTPPNSASIDPRVRIGHVHLKVADLQRATDFYCGVLGFHVTGRVGDGMVFVAAGDYHHHIALNSFYQPELLPYPMRRW